MTDMATNAKPRDWREFRVVRFNGQKDTHKWTGEDYSTSSLADIFAFAPTKRPKEGSPAFIPSEHNDYDARVHARQKEVGSYVALVGDIDKGNHDLDWVKGLVEKISCGAAWFIHSSSNSRPGNMRWRIIFPLAKPAAFAEWNDAQHAFFAIMENYGAVMDKALARAGQPVYLPNIPKEKDGEPLRDKDGNPLYYQSEICDEGRPGLDIHSGNMAKAIAGIHQRRAQKEIEDQKKRVENLKRKANAPIGDGSDIIKEFNSANTVQSLLLSYGYTQSPRNKDDWRSPYQQGDTYATRIMDGNRWVSLSESDAGAGIGIACDSGCCGDAYDLYAHYTHKDDHKAAYRQLYREKAIASGNVVEGPWEAPPPPDEYDIGWEPVSHWEEMEEIAKSHDPESQSLTLISPAIWDGVQPPEREWRWQNFIPNHQATLLTGAGATGKSLLSQQMATCIGMGLPVLGVHVSPVPSLYITCEDDAEELHRRQTSICAALGVPLSETMNRLYLLSLYGELGNELCTFADNETIIPSDRYNSIVATCQHLGIKHVVLDNSAHLFTGDENKRSHVTSFLNLCNRMAREIDGSVIIVGHPNKAGDSYSGSTAWENNVRSRIFMSRILDEQGNAKDPDARILKNEKANYSQQGNQIEFRWHRGAFALDTDLPKQERDSIAENVLAAHENAVFLKCLDILTAQKRKVGASIYGNYAPKAMAAMVEAQGMKVKQFEAAMERLFSIGEIAAEVNLWPGKDRHPVTGLGRKDHKMEEN